MYEDAYRVPFRLDRRPPAYRFLNESDEPVHGVAVIIHGASALAANNPVKLQPGEELEVTIDPRHRVQGALLVVRWFRPDGVEYLWRAKL
jgi:hypothetical protein